MAPAVPLRLVNPDGGWEKVGDFTGSASLSVPWWVRRVTVERPEEPASQACIVSRRKCGRAATPRPGASSNQVPEDAVAAGPSTPLTVGMNELWVQVPASASGSQAEDTGAGVWAAAEQAASTEPQASLLLKVERQEPLALLLAKMAPFELARLSVLLFFIVLLVALQLQMWSLFAVPLLALIPVCRVCPDIIASVSGRGAKVSTVFTTGEEHAGYTVFAKGDRAKVSAVFAKRERAAYSFALCVFAVWIAYVILAWLRSAYGPYALPPAPPPPPAPVATPPPAPEVPQLDCTDLDGIDCSDDMQAWAGPGNCAVLAETQGTCKAYCGARGRICVKAVDDDSSNKCVAQKSGFTRQTIAENGCMQDWRTQICACSPIVPPPAPPEPELAPAPEPSEEVLEAPAPQPEPELATEPHEEEELQQWYPPAPPPEFQFEATSPCFTRNAEYSPIMRGEGNTMEATAVFCQLRCSRAPGCAYFTWRPDSVPGHAGFCILHAYGSAMLMVPNAVAGPSDCHDEAELAAIRGEAPAVPHPPELGERSQRMADRDGDQGVYTGSVDGRGNAHGRGQLQYDQGQLFIGDFRYGDMWEGVVYDFSGVVPTAKDTMHAGSWKNPVDWSIVARFPPSGQPADSMSHHAQAEPQGTKRFVHERQPEAVRAKTDEPFMIEGSLWTIIIVVLAFLGFAASGVLERPT